MALFNAASAVGNIVGPLLFKTGAPRFLSGVKAVLAIFCALIGAIGLQVALLWFFNQQRQRQRVAAGKPKYIHDTSMDDKYQAYGTDVQDATAVVLGQNGESFTRVLGGNANCSPARYDRHEERRVCVCVLRAKGGSSVSVISFYSVQHLDVAVMHGFCAVSRYFSIVQYKGYNGFPKTCLLSIASLAPATTVTLLRSTASLT